MKETIIRMHVFHIKNISMLYSPSLKTVRLAPAYDLISTVIYEDSTHEMAFSIGSKRDVFALKRDSFKKLADSIGISDRMANERFDSVLDRFEEAIAGSSKELAEIGFKDAKKIAKKIIKESPYKFLNH